MWFSTHALAGMALATRIESIPLLALTGLGSHVLLDMIPHRDAPNSSWALLDVVSGILIGYFLWRGFDPGYLLLWGAFFACCPDIETLLKEWGILQKTCFPSHQDRCHGRWPSPWGVLPNLLAGLLSLLVVVYR